MKTDPAQVRELYRASHSPDQIAERLESGPESFYLKDFIYGAVDGAVTTFAVVAGVAGAQLSAGIIIILGFANLLADGFSMAISNFLGTRSENQLRQKARNQEFHEIRHWPKGEREEVRQIYSKKGFEGELLEQIVEVITSDKQRWVDTMLQEEHGLALRDHNAVRAGVATFAAFNLVGLIPLLPYLGNWLVPGLVSDAFAWSSVLTCIAFFWIGAIKSRFVNQKWHVSSLETVLIGSLAAGLAYGVGILLKGFVEV